MGSSVALRGVALHRGGPAEVRLVHAEGPVVIAQRGAEARLEALRPVRTSRGVTVASEDGRVRVDLIEHLLAAIGGLGIGGGLRIETDDDEVPLLDGGALRFAEALRTLELPRRRGAAVTPLMRVARDATLDHGRSVYRFTTAKETSLRVEVDFPAPVGRQRATWDGEEGDFVARIAPARTFGWTHELEALRAEGRAAEVDLASVLVFDERGPIAGCRPPGPEEPARHKLLDLIGDLALHGGPPIGVIDAFAPGHTATHAVVARAIGLGVLVIDPVARR